MKKIIIIGAGGFGKEVAWTIQRINQGAPTFELLGFCDDAAEKQQGLFYGMPLLGSVAEAMQAQRDAGFMCAIGNNRVRETIVERLKAHGCRCETLIDPAAHVAPDVVIGEGCFVGIGSIVSVGAVVGCGVIVNSQSTVGHDVVLGDYAQLCPGVRLSGQCTVGRGVLFGTQSGTVPGRRIGDWATIGAGTVALRHVAAGQTLMRI